MARKRLIFDSLVLSIYTYGMEAWTISPKLLTKISGAYTQMVRYVKNVRVHSAATAVSNAVLFEGFIHIEDYLLKRRLTFAGHCARSKQPIADLMLACNPTNNSKRWTATNYAARLVKDVIDVIPAVYLATIRNKPFLTHESLRQCMLNRDVWHDTVSAALAKQTLSRTHAEKVKRTQARCSRAPRKALLPYNELKDPAGRDRNLRKSVAARLCRHPGCGIKCVLHCLQCNGSLADHQHHPTAPPTACHLCRLLLSPSCPQPDIERFEDQDIPAGHAFLCNDCYGICRLFPMLPKDRDRVLSKQ